MTQKTASCLLGIIFVLFTSIGIIWHDTEINSLENKLDKVEQENIVESLNIKERFTKFDRKINHVYSSLNEKFYSEESKAEEKPQQPKDEYKIYYEIVTSTQDVDGETKVMYSIGEPRLMRAQILYDYGSNTTLYYWFFKEKNTGQIVHIYDKGLKFYPIIEKVVTDE